MVVYQCNMVNNQCGTLKDVFDENEKRLNIKLFVTMNMGCINVVHDVVVGHG